MSGNQSVCEYLLIFYLQNGVLTLPPVKELHAEHSFLRR
jgi:hypothetical protein